MSAESRRLSDFHRSPEDHRLLRLATRIQPSGEPAVKGQRVLIFSARFSPKKVSRCRHKGKIKCTISADLAYKFLFEPLYKILE